MLALTAHVFVSNYLFIKSYGCSTEHYIHCFGARIHFLVVNSTELDCTDSDSVANITSIICYDLTLNFPRAIGAAATTLAGGAIYYGLIIWVLLKLSSQEFECWKDGSIKTVTITAVQAVVMLVALIIIQARLVALLIDEDTVYEDIVLLIIYNYVLIIGGLIPWQSFEKSKSVNNGTCKCTCMHVQCTLNTK